MMMLVGGKEQRRLLALASKERLVKILEKMLDEDEFLSEHGIRSWVVLFRRNRLTLPTLFTLQFIKETQGTPVGDGCQRSAIRGWLLAWRFTIWDVWWKFKLERTYLWVFLPFNLHSVSSGSVAGLATNFLLIESLQRFYQYYGDDLQASTMLSDVFPKCQFDFWIGGMSYRKWLLYESCGRRRRNSTSNYPHLWPWYAGQASHQWWQSQVGPRPSLPRLCLVLRSKQHIRIVHFIGVDITLSFSFSMLTTVEVLAHHIRLGGELYLGILRALVAERSRCRSGLVAYHILQSGVSCRLPKTPRSKSVWPSCQHWYRPNRYPSFRSTAQSCEPLLRCLWSLNILFRYFTDWLCSGNHRFTFRIRWRGQVGLQQHERLRVEHSWRYISWCFVKTTDVHASCTFLRMPCTEITMKPVA